MQMSIKETTFFDRGMEQLVAREAHNLEVVGSSPTPATEKPSRNRRFFYFLTVFFRILQLLATIVLSNKGSVYFSVLFINADFIKIV